MLIEAATTSVYPAIWETNIGGSWLIRLLFFLRGLPKPFLTLKGVTHNGFVVLREDVNMELNLGLIAKPWKPTGEILQITATEFNNFNQKGWVKVVWNFRLEEVSEQTVELSTETRIHCTDTTSKWFFSIYWFFVAPFSGIVRTEMLKLIKKRAEEALI